MNKRTAPLIVGNWKTTPATKEEAVTFIKKLEKKVTSSKIKLPKKSYYLAVPDIFIPYITPISKNGYIGAENVSGLELGQHTGAFIPSQLQSGGASFVIIGHSEVRASGESREARATKIALSLQAKLPTIFCVGEKVRDKEGGYLAELEDDIKETLGTLPRNTFENLIIAYEPVWAIGGKSPATPQECFEVVIALRRALASIASIDFAKKVHILYGGAVTIETAKSFIDDGGVDGLLIGRSSQDVSQFFDIIATCHIK
jgi:triosephosphate isomerase